MRCAFVSVSQLAAVADASGGRALVVWTEYSSTPSSGASATVARQVFADGSVRGSSSAAARPKHPQSPWIGIVSPLLPGPTTHRSHRLMAMATATFWIARAARGT